LALVVAGCSSSSGSNAAPTTAAAHATTSPAPATTTPGAAAVAFGSGNFYAPPATLPKGPHGTLIRYQAIPGYGPGGAKAYRILYTSVSVPGKPIVVSGTALVPTTPAPAAGRNLLTIAHGTTGIADECAPSKSPQGTELSLTGSAASAGFLVAMSDYEGLGTPGVHPYLVGVSEGRGVLDAITAAGQLPNAHPGTKLAIAGYSQGGQGALWADQLAATWTPKLHAVGTFAGAPASEVDIILAAAPSLARAGGFGYMLIAGLHAAYPKADLAQILTPTGLHRIGDVDHGCARQVIIAFASTPASELISGKGASTGEWAKLAKANDPGQVKTPDPTLIIQSQADDTVPIAFSATLLKRMCFHGQVAQRIVLHQGMGHTAAAIPAYQTAMTWLLARFQPHPPPVVDDCRAR
ncbi:MAG TPA: lipase family protein, partial [Acidimicrobiales bacterium]